MVFPCCAVCEPLIAGLEPDGTPYVVNMDTIGALGSAENFVVVGNHPPSLLGACESMYRPGLNPSELFEVISQCMLTGVGRDCLSGWGAVVHVM